MSWHQGTSSHTMEHRSEETAWKMAWGEFPFSRTALLPVNREPNQCIFAPVWYRGGMQRNTSSWVVAWWMASIRADWARAWCLSRMALGKPVVPEE